MLVYQRVSRTKSLLSFLSSEICLNILDWRSVLWIDVGSSVAGCRSGARCSFAALPSYLREGTVVFSSVPDYVTHYQNDISRHMRHSI